MGNNSSASDLRPPSLPPRKSPVHNKPLPPLPPSDRTSVPLVPRNSMNDNPKSFSMDQIEQELASPSARERDSMGENRKPRRKLQKYQPGPGNSLSSFITSADPTASEASNINMTALPRAKSELSLFKSFGKQKLRDQQCQPAGEVTKAMPMQHEATTAFALDTKGRDRSAPPTLLRTQENRSLTNKMKGMFSSDTKSRSPFTRPNRSNTIAEGRDSLTSLKEEPGHEHHSSNVPQFELNYAVRENLLHSPKAQRAYGLSPQLDSEVGEQAFSNSPKATRFFGDMDMPTISRRHSSATSFTDRPFKEESRNTIENDDPFTGIHHNPQVQLPQQNFGRRFASSAFDLLATPRAFFDGRKHADSRGASALTRISNPVASLPVGSAGGQLGLFESNMQGLSEAERRYIESQKRGLQNDPTLERRKEILDNMPSSDWPGDINRDAYLNHTTEGTEDLFLNRPWESYKDPLPVTVKTSSPDSQDRPTRPLRPGLGLFLSNQLSGLAQHGNVMSFAEPPSGMTTGADPALPHTTSKSSAVIAEKAKRKQITPRQSKAHAPEKRNSASEVTSTSDLAPAAACSQKGLMKFSSSGPEAATTRKKRNNGARGLERKEKRRGVYMSDSPTKGNFDPEFMKTSSKSEKAFYRTLPASCAILSRSEFPNEPLHRAQDDDEHYHVGSSLKATELGQERSSLSDSQGLRIQGASLTGNSSQIWSRSTENSMIETNCDPGVTPSFESAHLIGENEGANQMSHLSGLSKNRSISLGLDPDKIAAAKNFILPRELFGEERESSRSFAEKHQSTPSTKSNVSGNLKSFDMRATLRQSQNAVRREQDESSENVEYSDISANYARMSQEVMSEETSEGTGGETFFHTDSERGDEDVADENEDDEANDADTSTFSSGDVLNSDRPVRLIHRSMHALPPVLDYPDDEEPFIGTPDNTTVVPIRGIWGKAKLVDIPARKKKANDEEE